jgi:hypothetical protein
MSDTNAGKTDDKKDPTKEEEEEDPGYTCKKCCHGYAACIVWTCKVHFL